MALGELKVNIPAPAIRSMKVRIVGTAPLIFHKWSEKAKRQMLEKQQKKATAGKHEIRNPQKEYEESIYKNAEGKLAFPTLCIKQAIVGAARNIPGVTMTLLRGAVFILGDKDGLCEVKYKKLSMREDMVRLGQGQADLRFRAEAKDWTMDFLVKYNEDVISPEQVLNLLQTAGFSSGLGEWRPERNGDFGTFTLENK